MFRNIVLVAVLMALAGCTQESKPKTSAELAAETIKNSDTKTEVAAYFACLAEVAPRTPNGPSSLDLDRIDTVIKACTVQQDAMKAKIATVWPPGQRASRMDDRLKGIEEEAWKIIRSKPFEPPSETGKAS